MGQNKAVTESLTLKANMSRCLPSIFNFYSYLIYTALEIENLGTNIITIIKFQTAKLFFNFVKNNFWGHKDRKSERREVFGEGQMGRQTD